VLGTAGNISSSAFTQVVLRVDEKVLGLSKANLMTHLTANGVSNWHANFELINSLTFFRSGGWRDWVLRGDIDRVEKNNAGGFPAAEQIFAHSGLGLGKINFLSTGNRRHLKTVLRSVTRGAAT
jgi:hypothetical protein